MYKGAFVIRKSIIHIWIWWVFFLFFFLERGDADWLGMMKTCETILLNMYNITLITRGA